MIQTDRDNTLFNSVYHEAYNYVSDYVASVIYDCLQAGGIHFSRHCYQRREVIEQLRPVEKYRSLVYWAVSFLLQQNFLEEKEGVLQTTGYAENFAKQRPSVSVNIEPSLQLIDHVGRSWVEIVTGQAQALPVMFGASGEELWERYFNNSHDLYAVHNQWAAETLADLIQKGRSKILELGVGYGSATQALLAECALRELQIEYTLSDKSLFLLRKARNALKQREEAVITSVAIDINRLEQHAEKQFDLIYAVNVLHCASDIEKTLRDLRGMLSTGGTIVISECVRSGYGHKLHQEFMFSLMPGFEMINHSPDDPAFGFLTPADWQGLLQRAGYRHVEISVNAGGNIRGAIAVGVRE